MPQTPGPWHFPYPSLSNSPNVPGDIQALAQAVENALAGRLIVTAAYALGGGTLISSFNETYITFVTVNFTLPAQAWIRGEVAARVQAVQAGNAIRIQCAVDGTLIPGGVQTTSLAAVGTPRGQALYASGVAQLAAGAHTAILRLTRFSGGGGNDAIVTDYAPELPWIRISYL
jgi:hypothetical protein